MNLIESVITRPEEKTASVDHSQTNEKKLRSSELAPLAVEKQFRRVTRYMHPLLLFADLSAKMSNGQTTTEATA
jgi:hypothetical protein